MDEVKKHRHIVVGKFNRGVGTDSKKRTWAEISARVNEIGECQREVLEVIKKWSDLKCDTMRKVAAMRTGTVPHRGLGARMSRDLSPTEQIVHQILEMDKKDDPSKGDGLEEEDDALEDEDMMALESSFNGDSSQAYIDRQHETSAVEDWEAPLGDSDDEQRDDVSPPDRSAKPSGNPASNNGVSKYGAAAAPPAKTAPSPLSAVLPGSERSVRSARDSLLESAALSLHEQHATNLVLETATRSLDLLTESVQQLAETQQEFVRESLRLQRETVQALRDFAGGAIALMHDKLNGRPAL